MKAIISSISVHLGQVFVLLVILDMSHLMEDCSQVFINIVSGAHSKIKYGILIFLLTDDERGPLSPPKQISLIIPSPDSVILGIIEVPSCGMTDDISAICWLLQHAEVPEGVRDPEQSHGRVEVISSLEHLPHRVVLLSHSLTGVYGRLARERFCILTFLFTNKFYQ